MIIITYSTNCVILPESDHKPLNNIETEEIKHFYLVSSVKGNNNEEYLRRLFTQYGQDATAALLIPDNLKAVFSTWLKDKFSDHQDQSWEKYHNHVLGNRDDTYAVISAVKRYVMQPNDISTVEFVEFFDLNPLIEIQRRMMPNFFKRISYRELITAMLDSPFTVGAVVIIAVVVLYLLLPNLVTLQRDQMSRLLDKAKESLWNNNQEQAQYWVDERVSKFYQENPNLGDGNADGAKVILVAINEVEEAKKYLKSTQKAEQQEIKVPVVSNNDTQVSDDFVQELEEKTKKLIETQDTSYTFQITTSFNKDIENILRELSSAEKENVYLLDGKVTYGKVPKNRISVEVMNIPKSLITICCSRNHQINPGETKVNVAKLANTQYWELGWPLSFLEMINRKAFDSFKAGTKLNIPDDFFIPCQFAQLDQCGK